MSLVSAALRRTHECNSNAESECLCALCVVRYQGYGPSEWAIVAPDAAGFNQSPVVIYPEQAQYDHHLKDHPLHIRYDAESVRSLQNTGHTIQIDITGNSSSKLRDCSILQIFHRSRLYRSVFGDSRSLGRYVLPISKSLCSPKSVPDAEVKSVYKGFGIVQVFVLILCREPLDVKLTLQRSRNQ